MAAANSGVARRGVRRERPASACWTSPSWSKSGCGQPLVQGEGVAGGGEDRAAVDDAQRAVHAQAQTFEHGGEVPGIDRLAVDRGLAAHRIEPGAVQEGRRNGWPASAWSSRASAAAACASAPASAGSGFFPAAAAAAFRAFFPPHVRTGRRRAAPPRAAVRVESTTCAPGYANRAIRCNSPVIPLRLPFPPFVCPISPLVGHSNLGQSGAA